MKQKKTEYMICARREITIQKLRCHVNTSNTRIEIERIQSENREWKILRKILRPKKIQGKIMSVMNHEIKEMVKGKDILQCIEAQRLIWFGHIPREKAGEIMRK